MKRRYDTALSPDEITALEDKDIDTEDIPPLDEAFWNNARVVWPRGAKKQITMRLDADLVAWFKSQGKGYQTRMNAVLRSYYEAQRESMSQSKKGL